MQRQINRYTWVQVHVSLASQPYSSQCTGDYTCCQMLAGQLSCSASARTNASTAKLVRTSTCNCVETNCLIKRCSIFSLSRKHAAITRHKRVARTRIRNLELFQNGVPYQALPELKLTRVQRSPLVIIARARRERPGDEAMFKAHPLQLQLHLINCGGGLCSNCVYCTISIVVKTTS